MVGKLSCVWLKMGKGSNGVTAAGQGDVLHSWGGAMATSSRRDWYGFGGSGGSKGSVVHGIGKGVILCDVEKAEVGFISL